MEKTESQESIKEKVYSICKLYPLKIEFRIKNILFLIYNISQRKDHGDHISC